MKWIYSINLTKKIETLSTKWNEKSDSYEGHAENKIWEMAFLVLLKNVIILSLHKWLYTTKLVWGDLW